MSVEAQEATNWNQWQRPAHVEAEEAAPKKRGRMSNADREAQGLPPYAPKAKAAAPVPAPKVNRAPVAPPAQRAGPGPYSAGWRPFGGCASGNRQDRRAEPPRH